MRNIGALQHGKHIVHTDSPASPHNVKREYFRDYLAHFARHPLILVVPMHGVYQEGQSTGWFRHEDFYALYVVRSGRGIHLINDHPYSVVRGDVYIATPGSVHAYRNYCGLEVDAFHFQIELFSDAELEALRSLPGFWKLIAAGSLRQTQGPPNHRLRLPPEWHQPAENMVDEIWAEYAEDSPTGGVLARSLFFRLLVQVARWHAVLSSHVDEVGEGLRDQNGKLSRKSNPYEVQLTDVLRVCEERFHEPLTVSQLASLMFLSTGHFSEIFTREVGMPPGAYLRRLRLIHAQTLLRTTLLSATDIAHQVGFNDSAQFSRMFRASFGMTPTAYRATFKNKSSK